MILSPSDVKALTEIPPFRMGGAVYFLWDGDELVYIGQTCRPAERVQTHADQGRIEFTKATFLVCANPDDRLDLEIAYIRRYRPPFNRLVR